MGKSQTLKRKGGIPKRSSRVVFWDNNKDHDAHRFDKMSGFFDALDRANKSGKGFRIAYTGEASPDLFEDWAEGVWDILDGRKTTHLVVEEYSDCCTGPGLLSIKKEKYHRRLWTQSRKYGGILLATSQRPQLISNDSIGNVGQIWAGSMDLPAAKRIGGEIGIDRKQIQALPAGHFFHWKGGLDVERVHVFTPRQ